MWEDDDIQKYYVVLIALLLIAVAAGCGSQSGGNNPQPTPRPTPQPTPQPGACNSPALNSPFVNNGTEEFYVYTAEGSTLDTRVFSDGITVYEIISDGKTIFGFTGFPTGAGTACQFFSAAADFNMDGVFDETAASFLSRGLRLANGAEFTSLDGPSSVDASQEFENDLLVLYNQTLYFNIYDPLSCGDIEPVSESGIYQSLLTQLETQASAP